MMQLRLQLQASWQFLQHRYGKLSESIQLSDKGIFPLITQKAQHSLFTCGAISEV